MKRRCKVIIAIDAEADPTMSFGAFLILERSISSDCRIALAGSPGLHSRSGQSF